MQISLLKYLFLQTTKNICAENGNLNVGAGAPSEPELTPQL
jgi:hypothetical protein